MIRASVGSVEMPVTRALVGAPVVAYGWDTPLFVAPGPYDSHRMVSSKVGVIGLPFPLTVSDSPEIVRLPWSWIWAPLVTTVPPSLDPNAWSLTAVTIPDRT